MTIEELFLCTFCYIMVTVQCRLKNASHFAGMAYPPTENWKYLKDVIHRLRLGKERKKHEKEDRNSYLSRSRPLVVLYGAADPGDHGRKLGKADPSFAQHGRNFVGEYGYDPSGDR